MTRNCWNSGPFRGFGASCHSAALSGSSADRTVVRFLTEETVGKLRLRAQPKADSFWRAPVRSTLRWGEQPADVMIGRTNFSNRRTCPANHLRQSVEAA